MKSKNISSLQWGKYLIELLVIIAGILGAFALDSWNDQRMEKELIREVILEIAENLEDNLGDLRPDADIHYQGLLSNIKVQNYLDSDTTYQPEMCFDFHFLQVEEYTYPNKTGYDRLRNMDVKVLEHDSLLDQVTHIYDYYYPRISKGSGLYPDIKNYLHQFYLENFEINKDSTLRYDFQVDGGTISYPIMERVEGWPVMTTIGYIPKDFEALKNDSEFQLLLKETLGFRAFKHNRYRALIGATEELLRHIYTEYEIEYDLDEK